MSDPHRIPSWQECTERLLAKLPALIAQDPDTHVTVNDARTIQYLAGLLCAPGRWLVINVGCLECGNPTDITGTYDTYEEALAATERYGVLLSKVDSWHGEGITLICDLEGTRKARP